MGSQDGAVGLGNASKAGRSRVGFSVIILLVDTATNRNEYREYFLGGKGGWSIGLTNIPRSCYDCFEIWKPEASGILRTCLSLYMIVCTP